jgi:hypothetical protein
LNTYSFSKTFMIDIRANIFFVMDIFFGSTVYIEQLFIHAFFMIYISILNLFKNILREKKTNFSKKNDLHNCIKLEHLITILHR